MGERRMGQHWELEQIGIVVASAARYYLSEPLSDEQVFDAHIDVDTVLSSKHFSQHCTGELVKSELQR